MEMIDWVYWRSSKESKLKNQKPYSIQKILTKKILISLAPLYLRLQKLSKILSEKKKTRQMRNKCLFLVLTKSCLIRFQRLPTV